MAGTLFAEVPVMADLDTKDRNRLRDSSFAWIDKQGERHLPINDESHVRNAISRFNQTDFDEPGAKPKAARKIMAAAKKYGIDVDTSDDVARAAKR
jgi:hypothetical protein